jgi:hypothetical protein
MLGAGPDLFLESSRLHVLELALPILSIEKIPVRDLCCVKEDDVCARQGKPREVGSLKALHDIPCIILSNNQRLLKQPFLEC